MTHVEQPADALTRLRAAIAAHDDHRLVALHAGITITGSAVLGLAFAAKALTAEDAFAAAQIDETIKPNSGAATRRLRRRAPTSSPI